jgi:EAL domain-containing protein (putative c-di-GMP-specific phosphodiesterase class I)/ActR/RegA family two-component response regulator
MSPVAAAPGRILLVDDDDALLRTLMRSLKRFGHVVEPARDGHAAIAGLENGAFDVVLSDISMPGMNGLELLLAVRQVDLDVPVVLMTGAPDLATATRAVEYGALRYLTKPIDLDELAKVTDQAVRFCRLARVKRQALHLVGNVHQFVGDRAGLEARFGKALDTLWMAYQPILSWTGKSLYAYEALVRNGEPTLADPVALFSAAERLGRLHDLGRSIRKAVASAVTAAGCKLFVNLHTLDFTDRELFSMDAPLSHFANKVVLEITERESLDQIKDVQSDIKRLREMGYQLAVDDLGAGYAGLTSLTQLQPEVVKIDMSLVRGVDHEPTKRMLIEMMLGMAREMHMTVVAEGVETVAERTTLVGIGCDLLQGFLFAKPERTFSSLSWNELSAGN